MPKITFIYTTAQSQVFSIDEWLKITVPIIIFLELIGISFLSYLSFLFSIVSCFLFAERIFSKIVFFILVLSIA